MVPPFCCPPVLMGGSPFRLFCLPAFFPLPEFFRKIFLSGLYLFLRCFLLLSRSLWGVRLLRIRLQAYNTAVSPVDKKVDCKRGQAFPINADDGEQGERQDSQTADDDLCGQGSRKMEHRKSDQQGKEQCLCRIPQLYGPAEDGPCFNKIWRDDVDVVFFLSCGHF